MGLTAIVSSTMSSLSLMSPIGMGVGGVFVVAALVAFLAYLDVIQVKSDQDQRVQSMLYAVITPLAVAFLGIILFRSLQAL